LANAVAKKLYLFRMEKACEIARRKGAIFNEAVATAMGALESNWGTSQLSQKANNLFGIKAGSSWTGETIELPTWEWYPSKGWVRTTAKWRKYLSWNLCLVDYANLIANRPWFRDALQHLNDPEKFLESLLPTPTEWGWATDPKYKDKVIDIALEIQRLGGPAWEKLP